MKPVGMTGGFVRDPELKYTTNGTAVCKFGLGMKKVRDRNESDYFDCVIFGKGAETIAQYMKKGNQIEVTGYDEQQRWDDNKKSKVVTVVTNFMFLGGGKKESADDEITDYDAPF